MTKFFVLYRVPVDVMDQWKKDTSPEEMQTQMAKMGTDMNAWNEMNKDAIIDAGQPLGKNTRMTADGHHAEANDLNFYCIVQAESAEAVVEMHKDSPHMTIPKAYLDIMEIPHMGM